MPLYNPSTGGTVTDVTGVTPIASTGGATPAVSLNDTAVTPGAYTNAGITVDAKGRITAAANGAGGSVSLETPTGVVDGVNDEFVFVSTPVAIFRNGVLQAADVYTIVGTTVTFDTPPASGVISGLTQ